MRKFEKMRKYLHLVFPIDGSSTGTDKPPCILVYWSTPNYSNIGVKNADGGHIAFIKIA